MALLRSGVIVFSLLGPAALAQDATLPDVTVTDERQSPEAASTRIVSRQELGDRPITRPGEVLESVPGLIVTQHSGEGKANQYFLRGFNLDHGTDLAFFLDGMPLNMRTHGHGQGYADLNFLIPELLAEAKVRKGPYFAEEGDFSSAGSVRLNYVDRLDSHLIAASFGSFGHRRLLGATSQALGEGTVLAAGEFTAYDGPWSRPDDLRKLNAVLRYSQGTDENGLSVTAMAYVNRWSATDQIPQRAVEAGVLGRYDTLDPTDGGATSRFSLSGRYSRRDEASATRIEAFAIRSSLELFNNFTYALDNPVEGDQFRQGDERTILGLNARHTLYHSLMGRQAETTIGFQSRFDAIRVALQRTQNRAILSTVRDDAVQQASLAAFGEVKLRWTDWLRTTVGWRADYHRATVLSDLVDNSGTVDAALLSPKGGLVLGPFRGVEFFANAGQGFHSNDARGATARLDPNDRSTALAPVPLLVRSQGAEIGLRTGLANRLETSLAAFWLDFNSENLFVGDAGTTIASRPSRRVGLEWTAMWKPFHWLRLDVDAAWTEAKFTNEDPAGQEVPGAPAIVASGGFTADDGGRWFAGARLRYFGPRPLIEDNSVRSDPTFLVNARLGYRIHPKLTLSLDVFNLLDQPARQIDYFYTSRIPGEALGGIADRHFHPVEPRSFRLTMRGTF